MAFLKKGTKVRIKRSTAVGEIAGYHVSADQEVITYLVNFKDPESDNPDEVNQRTLLEEQIVVVNEAPEGGN